MAIRNYVNSSIAPRRVARIVTVHPASRKIEGQLKDGGNIQISLFDVPPFFVWPQEGEYWIVRQDGGYWKLSNKFDGNDDQQVETLNPGEAKVAADVVVTPSGRQFTTTAEADYQWVPLLLINGWEDASTFDEDQLFHLADISSINIKYLDEVPTASYQYNKFRRTIYFRGIIYNSDYSNEFATLDDYKPNTLIFGLLGLYFLNKEGVFGSTDTTSSGETFQVLDGLSIQMDNPSSR